MARIRPLTREEAAAEIRPFYDANVRAFGQVLNTTGIYAYRPTIQLGVRALADGIQKSGLVPDKLRCLINVRIASQVGCGY
jgi:hypothetical protein